MSEEIPQNELSDEEKVKEQKKNVKKKAELAKERLRKIMLLPEAQDWVFELLDELYVFRLSFHPSGAQTAFNEGERSVGLKIMDRWIEASEDTFFQTMKRKKGAKNA